MAQIVGDYLKKIADPTIIDTAIQHTIMARGVDETGNHYIYLKGVASTVIGTWVTYDELGITTRLVANAIGPIAIAKAATVANTWGWYLTYGSAEAKVSAAFADDGNLYATATAGEADDAIVAGDRIKNAIGRAAVASGTALCQVWYPFMDDGLSA